MKVRDPEGQVWRISRRWVPWRRRVKGGWDLLSVVPTVPGGDDPITGTINLIILIVFAPVLVIGLLIVLASLAEIFLLLLLIPVLIAARIAFGRRWVVEIRRGFVPYYEEAVGDWARSQHAIATFGAVVTRGQLPPRNVRD